MRRDTTGEDPGETPGGGPARGAPRGPPGTPRGCTFWRVFNNSPSRDKISPPIFGGVPRGSRRGPPGVPHQGPKTGPRRPYFGY